MSFIEAKGIVIICLENNLTNEDILTSILVWNVCFFPLQNPETNVISIHFVNCLTDNFNALSLALLYNLYNTREIPMNPELELPD